MAGWVRSQPDCSWHAAEYDHQRKHFLTKCGIVIPEKQYPRLRKTAELGPKQAAVACARCTK